jgi:phage shock protein PspC (stress-responsive transcriptional regulator)
MKRDPKNAMLAGVCAGLAKHLGISVLLTRVLFIIGTLWLGAPLIIYIILAVLMPPERNFIDSFKKLHRDDDNKMIGGVCAGIANISGLDVTLIRFLWVFTVLYFGFGIIPYVVLWILLPKKNKDLI